MAPTKTIFPVECYELIADYPPAYRCQVIGRVLDRLFNLEGCKKSGSTEIEELVNKIVQQANKRQSD